MLQDMLQNASWNKKLEVLVILRGLTQLEAANLCGTTQKVFWGWINGKSYPRPISRRAIETAFGVPEGDIFGKEANGNASQETAKRKNLPRNINHG